MISSIDKLRTVKNRRLKMSPGGIVTLPVSARKALRMEIGKGCRVTVSVENGSIVLAPTSKTGGFRVSPKGQLQLQGNARELLAAGVNRHYWIELEDGVDVKLIPFK